ncbi:MAG: RNA polymerase sigma factor [Candidatus Zixiibacteriota bacterium]|nr:MAG: RNA polymerase sigma factor [candidate division Zixibacteria bacterium]
MLDATVHSELGIQESELIRKVAAGERLAFKQLFDIHSPRVYNLLLRLVGNRDDAEELTQDVFLSLWKHAESLRGESKLSTWLYRVAVNKAINFKKRGGLLFQIRQLFSLEADDESIIDRLPAAAADSPDRQLEMQDARIQLADLLGTLPHRQREVYLLHKLEGLSYNEIAEDLHVTLGTIESLMHRAKENLQKVMLKKVRKSASKNRPPLSQ